jgi:hypothetical protein
MSSNPMTIVSSHNRRTKWKLPVCHAYRGDLQLARDDWSPTNGCGKIGRRRTAVEVLPEFGRQMALIAPWTRDSTEDLGPASRGRRCRRPLRSLREMPELR